MSSSSSAHSGSPAAHQEELEGPPLKKKKHSRFSHLTKVLEQKLREGLEKQQNTLVENWSGNSICKQFILLAMRMILSAFGLNNRRHTLYSLHLLWMFSVFQGHQLQWREFSPQLLAPNTTDWLVKALNRNPYLKEQGLFVRVDVYGRGNKVGLH